MLSCVPTASMTDAEMACCKKVGGNCDMGSGKHACCQNAMDRTPSVVDIAQNPYLGLPLVAIATANVSDDFFLDHNEEVFLRGPRATALPPLALKSILRI